MKYAIIVDGFSSGKLLFEELQARNISCIHVLTPEGMGSYKCHPEGYFFNIDFSDNDWESLLHKLSAYSIGYVFPGCEEGVSVAEELANKLGLPGNHPMTTQFRRDKYLMQEIIQKYNLPGIKQQLVVDISQCVSALNKIGSLPVIVKPVNDGGSINVYVCNTVEQTRESVEKLLAGHNSMGQPITHVLIQEMLQGDEYIVNTVTLYDTHHITDVWRYSKTYIPGGGVIATRVRLIDPQSMPQLIDYTKQVLDALEVTFGAAHTEVMVKDKKINLIETAGRIMGGGFTKEAWELMLTHNQVESLIACHIQPEDLKTMEFKVKNYACLVLLPIFTAGKILRISDIDGLKSRISSVYIFQQFVAVGDVVDVTRDDTGPYAGFMLLISNTNEALENDLAIVAEFEGQFLTIEI
ncbi:MAG: ATP-grasp domain-containing protein [Neisseriaceae bacterium]